MGLQLERGRRSARWRSTSRAVLDLLRQGSLLVGQIARAFPVSRPAISKQLRLLRSARLVQERREGRHHIYELNAMPLKEVDWCLSRYRSFWQGNLNNLKALVEREHAKEKSGPQKKRRRRKERRNGNIEVTPDVDAIKSEVRICGAGRARIRCAFRFGASAAVVGQEGIYRYTKFHADLRAGGKWRTVGVDGEGKPFGKRGNKSEMGVGAYGGGHAGENPVERIGGASGVKESYRGWPRTLE